MTVTRIKCRTKDCPFTPEEHSEWMDLCSRAPEHGHRHDQPSHQHIPKKGMGGKNSKSKIVAILCWPMHDRIDNGEWGNDIKEMPGRGRVYFAWDIHGNTLIEREVLSAAAEGIDDRRGDGHLKGTHSSAAAPSTKEESDGERAAPKDSPSDPKVDSAAGVPVGLDSGDGDRPVDGDSRNPSNLTHEQRVAIAQAIKDTEWNRQWFAGDTGNLWIEQLGESAEQYLSDFGYQPESLANILRVCAAIKPPYRNGNLRFSHHVVVYDQPPEVRMDWLAECEANEWSVAEFRRQVKGTKPRVKRWSLEELRIVAHGHYKMNSDVWKFFNGLEEQA